MGLVRGETDTPVIHAWGGVSPLTQTAALLGFLKSNTDIRLSGKHGGKTCS